jgi:hypothetical protein
MRTEGILLMLYVKAIFAPEGSGATIHQQALSPRLSPAHSAPPVVYQSVATYMLSTFPPSFRGPMAWLVLVCYAVYFPKQAPAAHLLAQGLFIPLVWSRAPLPLPLQA